MSFNSKYSGQQVENLLDQVANGNAGGGGGGIVEETDPIFSASPAAKITDEEIKEWNGKQDAISDLESIRNNASKGAQALGAIPTKVSELVNDAKYASAEDTDDVVEEPEGGGSAGGSNVYTLDIGEWDMESTKELTITAADIEGIGNADTVRVFFMYVGELPFPFYLYPTGELKFGEEGTFWWTGNAYSEGKNILVNIMVSEGEVYLAEISAEDIAPYQPIFAIGMYDEETDSWDNSEIADMFEHNMLSHQAIRETMMNLNTFSDFPAPVQVVEPTLEMAIINRWVIDSTSLGMVYERYDMYSRNKTVWLIGVDSDGVPHYEKME